MATRSVAELLDALAAGRVDAATVAADFRTRTWPARRRATEAQAWGVEDEPAPAPNSWELVESDSRLTTQQYLVLADAYRGAVR